MKHWKKRAAALGLALVLALTPAAIASEALGREVQGSSKTLSVGTTFDKQIFWSDTYSDLRTERYFTYTPNRNVIPTVVYGNKVLTKATLTDMAKSIESQGRRVIGGMNGDLYVLATGMPLGMVVTDGIARSIPDSLNADYYAVGFRSDGTAFVGQPNLVSTVTFKGITHPLAGGVNRIRNVETNYVIYTADFSTTTQNSEPGIDVVLTPVLEHIGETVTLDLDINNSTEPGVEPLEVDEVNTTVVQSDEPIVGGRVTYVVEEVLNSTGAIAIPEGKAILSINSKSDPYWINHINQLQPGDTVDLDITAPDSAWVEADQAMGGRHHLVVNGQVGDLSKVSTERTAYSAIGVKADGTAVFYTVDGKQPGYSVGATLAQVAARLIELGCVEAVSLDGGGSTTIGATYPDGTNMGVVNKPSDGKARANSVAVFLSTDLKPSGTLKSVYVTPDEGFLLSGAKVQMKAAGLDSNYYTMDLPGVPAWSVRNGDGMVDAEGIFTAGGSSGVTDVVATHGTATGSTTLTVVNNPDKVTLTDAANGQAVTALSVDPNGKVDLTATAYYKNLVLTAQDDCFAWSADEAIGTIDQNGVFTAGAKSASGNLAVAAGGATLIIPVSVAGHVNTLESFESGIDSTTASGGLTLSHQQGGDQVKYGAASLKVSYDAAGGAAGIVTTLGFKAGERNLNLWLYGDDSQNSLTATFATADGVTSEVMVGGLDFKGWKYRSVAIPEGAVALRSLNLIYGDSEKKTGSFWLDQITTSNEPVQDEQPPVVSVSKNGNLLTATAIDFMDKKFTNQQVKVTYDGKPLTSTVSGTDIQATLPAPDGKLHRVAVTVTDQSGNIGRAALNIDAAANQVPAFTDVTDHWAAPFATYLFDQKVTNGVPGAVEEELLFQPDKAITRGELFAMSGRWLGLDLTKYESVELPFADGGQIPDWALPAVKAMYALGYLKGSSGADGELYANVGDNITRVETMTILGRMQPKGYTVGDLTAFTDGTQVADWALGYVETLVGQGVVSGGGDSLIRPGAPITRGEVAKMLFTMT